jgi:hypothetical protein
MDRRTFFGSIGALFGVGCCNTCEKPAPKKPWHAPPYIVEVWKPFSNPEIFNAMTLGSPVFIKFDSLKQAENWAMARKSLLENADVNNGKMVIRSGEGQAVQIITWGRSWCHSTVYVDGPSGWNDDPAVSWIDTDENHDRQHEDI